MGCRHNCGGQKKEKDRDRKRIAMERGEWGAELINISPLYIEERKILDTFKSKS